SEALQRGTSMSVVLPQPTEEQIGVSSAASQGPPRVLYLLHGLSDDHSAWLRYSSVERYAAAAGLAVVMPAVNRSFYANERTGGRYWDFISEELPAIVGNFFRVSQDPAQTYVAGLSMGGYGAMKLALSHPERYAAAATLSGALDLDELASRPERVELFEGIFGDTVPEDANVFTLLEKADAATLPRIHVSTGTEDAAGLVEGNRRFVAALEEKGADVTTDFRPGEHVWSLWDTLLPEIIDWMLDAPGVPATA
ncbi:MAG: alpha/beta hydrolase family protein, partial [Nocardioides sp.]